MGRLIILGNGFDLYHGLPTSYKNDLVPILKELNSDLFEKLNKLYFEENIDLWSDFEKQIGRTKSLDCLNSPIRDKLLYLFNIDAISYPPESENYGNFWLEFEEARHEAESNRVHLETVFSEYHSDLDDVKEFFREGLKQMCKCANEANNKKNYLNKNILFSDNDYFISFNYTNTLEKIYPNVSKSNICYIHGTIEEEELIFGNLSENIVDTTSDLNEENEKYCKSDIKGCEIHVKQEFIDNVTYEQEEFDQYNENVVAYMNQLNMSMIKPIQIKRLKKFLEKLDIKKIYIFGFSMGKVDLPYFEMIYDLFPKAEWFISVYNSSTKIKENIEESKFEKKIKYLKTEKFLEKLNRNF